MPRKFEFVAVSNPSAPASSEDRRLTYSAAMRQSHAKKRHIRTQTYREESEDKTLILGQKAKVLALYGSASRLPKSLPGNGTDPFSSLARPLSSEEHFLLHHYVQVVVPFTIGHCGLFDYPGDHEKELLREWVGLAITDDAFMTAAILLSTCRYILKDRPQDPAFTWMALQYRQTCLRTLRQEVDGALAAVTIMTVAKAIALALDDVGNGEHMTARQHLKGVFTMVQICGGPEAIGLTGLLERMYHRFLGALHLMDKEVDMMCDKTLLSGQRTVVS